MKVAHYKTFVSLLVSMAIIITFIITFTESAYSQEPVVINDSVEVFPFGLHLSFFEVKEKVLTIEDITSPETDAGHILGKSRFSYTVYYEGISRPDGIAFDQKGDLFVINESSPQGLYRAKEGDTFNPMDAVTTIGYPFVSPDDILFYPDGTIYIADGQARTVFKVEKGSKIPVPFITKITTGSQNFNPYGLAISPSGFNGPNVKTGDIIVADNGHGLSDRSVLSVDPVTGSSSVINKGKVFKDGPLTVKFSPDGTLYVFENNDSGSSRIVILEANGDVKPFLSGIKERGPMAIHPVTGDIYFKNAPGEIHWVSKSGGTPLLFVSNIGFYQDIEFNSDGTDLYVSASELNQVLKISGPFRNIGDVLIEEYPILTIRKYQRQFLEHNNNNVKLSVSNDGVIGGNEVGFEYKGSKGLFEGALIIASSEKQLSVGIYESEFTPLNSIIIKLDKLKGFDQNYETSYTDIESINPIGVTIIQRTHSKSSYPDKNYIILEYEVINISGNDLDSIYIGIVMDWDISSIGQRDLAGYDFERNMIYMYDSEKSNESYYYGLSVLSHEVSGYSFSIAGDGSGTDNYLRGKTVYFDKDWYNAMTTFGQFPKVSADYRAVISVGPFNIQKGERIITKFKAAAGKNLYKLQANIDAIPIWEVLWFKLLSTLLLIIIIFSIYVANKQKNEKERILIEENERKFLEARDRIAQNLHDEIGSNLSGISFFAQAIGNEKTRKQNFQSKKFLSLIVESSNEAQEKMKDLIWTINPHNDNWNGLFAKFRRYASDMFDSKGIRYEMDFPSAISVKPLTMERRQHFWLIFKEMIINAAKHSECERAAVKVSILNGSVHLEVSDNGIGFDPDIKRETNGLKNIKVRAEKLGADCNLKTSPSGGTRWELEFSLDRQE